MDNIININSPNSINLKPIKYCHYCNKTDVKVLICSRCHLAKYCNQDCQRKAWPEHKKACQIKESPKKNEETPNEDVFIQLKKELEEACKPNPNPYLRDFQKELFIKEMKILELATKCVENNFFELANDAITKNTCMDMIRGEYFKVYAKKMFQNDKKNVALVMKQGEKIVPENKIRRIVIDQLCLTRHFTTAYICAMEENNLNERGYLLEVVAAGLQIIKKYDLAKLVAEKNPDEGRKRDILQMLERHL